MVALAPAASADVSNLDVTQVQLFNATDPGTASGYLQAAIDVQYSCPQGTGGSISGTYDSLDKSDDVPLVCIGQAVSQRLYARLPVTDHLLPAQPNVATDSVGVGYSLDGGGGGGLSTTAAATVAGSELQDDITDLFPPYDPSFASRIGHPSQIFVIYEPPLTTGGKTVDHYSVAYRLGQGQVHHKQLNSRNLLRGLKTNATYRMRIIVTATDGTSAATRAQDVSTPHRLHQKISLHANRHRAQLHHAVKLSGEVQPAHGGYVVLQKRKHGAWHDIGRMHLDSSGSFVRKVNPPLGKSKFRVRAPKTADFHSAVSSSVTVHVHR